MTEASYTAWDDKQYVWPPPEGWYQASDDKWWPEGYGPQPGAESTAEHEATVTDPADDPNDAADPADDTTVFDNTGVDNTGVDNTGVDNTGVDNTGDDTTGATVAEESVADVAAESDSDPSSIADVGHGALGAVGGLAGGAAAAAAGRLSNGVEGALPDTDVAANLDGSSGVDRLGDRLGDAVSGRLEERSGLVDAAAGSSPFDGPVEMNDLSTGSAAELAERARSQAADVAGAAAPTRLTGDSGSPGIDNPLADRPAAEGVFTDRTADLKPADLNPTDLNPTDLNPTDLNPTDLNPTDLNPADLNTAVDSANLDRLGGADLPDLDGGLDGALDPDQTQLDRAQTALDSAQTQAAELPGPPVQHGLSMPAPVDPDLGPDWAGAPTADADLWANPTAVPGAGQKPGAQPLPGHQTTPLSGLDLTDQSDDTAVYGQPNAHLAQAAPPPGPGYDPGQPGANQHPGQQAADRVGPTVPRFDANPEDMLHAKPKGRRSMRLLWILLGVLILAAVGAAVYWYLESQNNDTATEPAPATGPGSIDQPHARDTGVGIFYPDGDVNQRWVVEVLEPVRDASDEFGSGPADGDVFAATRIRVRNESGVDGASLSDLSFNLVTSDGDLIDRSDNQCGSTDDDLQYDASLSLGTVIEGAVCWEIPADDLVGLKLGVESSKVPGRVHIALD